MKLRLLPLPKVWSIAFTARNDGADSGTNGVLSRATIDSICGTKTLTAITNSSQPAIIQGARRTTNPDRRARVEDSGPSGLMGTIVTAPRDRPRPTGVRNQRWRARSASHRPASAQSFVGFSVTQSLITPSITTVPSVRTPRTRTGRSGSSPVHCSGSVSAMQVMSVVALAV